MIRRPPRSTQSRSSAASDVYKRQLHLPGGVPPGTVWAEPGVLSATGTRSGRRSMTWLSSTAHHRWLEAETDRLLAFGRAARLPEGGFGWLDDEGNVDPGHPCELWITSRMTYAYAVSYTHLTLPTIYSV